MGADRLYDHTGDAAIGGIDGNTLLPDLTNPGDDGANFAGSIDEVAVYNLALDDPDDDGDFGDSRVLDHFLAGGGVVDVRPTFHRSDTSGDGTINIADAVALLNFLFGGGPGSRRSWTQLSSHPKRTAGWI